jgi:homoserine kinase
MAAPSSASSTGSGSPGSVFPECPDITIPGSISNLGPGFDALSVAVQVYLRLRVVDVMPGEPGRLDFAFVDAPLVGENRIEVAFRKAQARFGDATPGLRLEVRTDIPMRAGLGSSAAATVAGLRLYEQFTSRRATPDLLAIATDIEGHPDNATAALLGGLTLSCQFADGTVDGRSWSWPADLRMIVATPAAELETSVARKMLPQQVSLRDAVFNLQRALLLVRALETGRYGDMREALSDRWHQPTRQAFVPGLEQALRIDDPAVLGVCLSGSGPSIAAFATEKQTDAAAAALRAVYAPLGLACTIRTLSAHHALN